MTNVPGSGGTAPSIGLFDAATKTRPTTQGPRYPLQPCAQGPSFAFLRIGVRSRPAGSVRCRSAVGDVGDVGGSRRRSPVLALGNLVDPAGDARIVRTMHVLRSDSEDVGA